MVDITNQTPAQTLSREMGLSEAAVERRRKIAGLTPQDLERIASIRDTVVARADEFTKVFFDYLGSLDEGRTVLANRAVSERARQLKKDHLVAMVQSDYGLSYVTQRLELALLYSKVGLDLRVFLAAFHYLLKSLGVAVMKQYEQSPLEGFETFTLLNKVAFFDIGLIVDVMVFERERVIRQQQDSIRELSTPVLQIRERLLLLPIIGVIDTHRARLITESLLRAIRTNRAKVVVMDITGVATIDSKVANHVLQTVTAAKLMGANVIITGLSAEVAQSLVVLGIDLAKLNTVGDLQGGLEEAEAALGYHVVRADDRAKRSPASDP